MWGTWRDVGLGRHPERLGRDLVPLCGLPAQVPQGYQEAEGQQAPGQPGRLSKTWRRLVGVLALHAQGQVPFQHHTQA